MAKSILDADYWNNRYNQHETGWDIGYSSTPLQHYADSLKDKTAAILIPGCGNAYEADYLLKQGFTNITLLDISPVLTAALKNRFSNTPIKIVTGDFFEHTAVYDLVLEQTFFCALDPSQRLVYMQKMNELLNPGGILAGVLFNRNFEEGPPFGGNKLEYMKLFSKFFTIQKMEDCYNSIKPRAGTELFFIAVKQ
jgi:SAM-dependent methyltransferase